LQAAAIGAILLASTVLLEGLVTKAPYDFNLYAAMALVALFGGFIFGGLATGLALMLVGVLVARFAEDYLERPEGIVTGIVTAAICVAVINALGQSNDSFWMLAAACFALPAAFLYRRQILLERAFRP
jgi:hypothetical protein